MKVKRIFISILLASLCLFSSCKNFLNSQDFLADLDKAIVYQNSQVYTIQVKAAEGIGVIIAGMGNNECKVTDSIAIGFQKNTGYNFIEWRAVSKDDEKTSRAEYVSFKDKTALETTVTLVQGANDILIIPVCDKTFAFTKTYPENVDEGKPCDSPIKMEFVYPLADSNDLSRITIKESGNDVTASFKTPEIIDGVLIFYPNLSKRISVAEGEIKTITVTLPEDFKYVSENGEFEIGKELSYSYRINSETTDKTKIKIGVLDENAGVVKINGTTQASDTNEYNIGEIIKITYKLDENYIFAGWTCSDDSSILVSAATGEEYDSKGFDSTTRTATVLVTVLGGNTQEISLQLQGVEKGKCYIDISSDFGNFTAATTGTYRKGDVKSLVFSVNTDYQFIYWKVTAANSNQTDLSAYITVEDIYNANTSFTVKEVSETLVSFKLEPVCIERPHVSTGSPMYDSDGVYRDRRITIMFDKKLDKDSIYFNESEIPAGNNVTPLTVGEGADKKCYGYYLDNDKNTIVYKCVSIVKLNDQSVNLLQYYGAPEFDDGNTGVLKISANDTVKPPAATDILVIVKTGFGLKYTAPNGKIYDVGIYNKYTWNFYTNAKTDTTPPAFENVKILMPNVSDITKYSDFATKSNLELTNINSDPIGTTGTNIPTYNAKHSKIWIQAKISDGGSGPSSLTAKVYKVNNSKFYPCTDSVDPVISYDAPLQFSGSTAEVYNTYDETKKDGSGNLIQQTDGAYFDISELGNSEYSNGGGQGLYKLVLTASDKNGLTNNYDKAFYFVYDVEKPAKPTNCKDTRQAAASTTASWTNSVSKDVKQVIVRRYLASDVNNILSTNTVDVSSNSNVVIDSLSDGTLYTYTFCAEDYAGNVSEICRYTASKPAAPVISAKSFGYKKGNVILKGTLQSDIYGHMKVTYSNNPETEVSYSSNNKKYEITVPLYTKGKQYSFDIRYTDFSGLTSDSVNFGKNDCYINNARNFVYKNTEIEKTSLVTVIERQTTYKLYNTDTKDLTFTDRNGNNATKFSSFNGPGNWGNSPRVPGAFVKNRSGSQSGGSEIQLQPYAIGQYECVNKLMYLIENKRSNDYYPIANMTFYQYVQFCNALSILYGFEPCYKLYKESGSIQEEPVDDWSFNWSIDTDKFNNTLVCDFTKNGFRLPSELEWENASRGAVQNRYENRTYQWFEVFAGAKSSYVHDQYWPYPGLAEYANYNNNVGAAKTVGCYAPNWINCYDMGGNVWEFCWDAYNNSQKLSRDTIYGFGNNKNGISGPVAKDNLRVVRGGCWADIADPAKSTTLWNSTSGNKDPTSVDNAFGFRLARTLGKD